MVSKSQKNENLKKLKLLADELCQHDFSKEFSDERYKSIVTEIKAIIDSGDDNVLNQKSKYEKLKCYETMYSKIKIILSKIKIS
jgi:hypothetical protein